MCGQVIASAVLGLGYIAFLFCLWSGALSPDLPEHAPGFETSTKTFNASTIARIQDTESATLLLDRVDAVVKNYADSAANLDAKANTILGFLGAGVSVLSVINVGEHPVAATATPLLGTGVVMIVLALVFSIFVLWARVELELNLEEYCTVDYLTMPNAKAIMAAQLAHGLLWVQRDAIRPQLRKNGYARTAQLSFAIGAIALVLNYAIPFPHGEAKTTATCTVDQKPKLTIDCDQGAK